MDLAWSPMTCTLSETRDWSSCEAVDAAGDPPPDGVNVSWENASSGRFPGTRCRRLSASSCVFLRYIIRRNSSDGDNPEASMTVMDTLSSISQ